MRPESTGPSSNTVPACAPSVSRSTRCIQRMSQASPAVSVTLRVQAMP